MTDVGKLLFPLVILFSCAPCFAGENCEQTVTSPSLTQSPSPQGNAYQLFKDGVPLVDMNLVIPRLKDGDYIAFSSGKAFNLGPLVMQSKYLSVFQLGNGITLHLPTFLNLRSGAEFDIWLYEAFVDKQKQMLDSYETLIDYRIPSIKVHEVDQSGEYLLAEEFPSSFVSLRSFIDKHQDLDSKLRDDMHVQLLEFAKKSAKILSFGSINILDALIYTQDRGWILSDWGDVRTIDSSANLNGSVFDGEFSHRASYFADEAARINLLNAYRDQYLPVYPNEFLTDLHLEISKQIVTERKQTFKKRKISATGAAEQERLQTLQSRMDNIDHIEMLRILRAFDHDGGALKLAKQTLDSNHSGKLFTTNDILGHFRSSHRVELSEYYQLRIFDDTPLYDGSPYDRDESLRYFISAKQYMHQYERLEAMEIPLLPAKLILDGKAILEPHIDLPLLTLREFLMRILLSENIGSTLAINTEELIQDLLKFARQVAPLEGIKELRLVDIVHVPDRGWFIRSFDGRAQVFQARQGTVAGTLFSTKALKEIGLGEDAEPYFRIQPRTAAQVFQLFSELRAVVKLKREIEHLHPCPVAE